MSMRQIRDEIEALSEGHEETTVKASNGYGKESKTALLFLKIHQVTRRDTVQVTESTRQTTDNAITEQQKSRW